MTQGEVFSSVEPITAHSTFFQSIWSTLIISRYFGIYNYENQHLQFIKYHFVWLWELTFFGIFLFYRWKMNVASAMMRREYLSYQAMRQIRWIEFPVYYVKQCCTFLIVTRYSMEHFFFPQNSTTKHVFRLVK